MKKKASMSLKIAIPTVMPASGLNPPNWGMPISNEPWRKGTFRSCENVVGESIPTIVPLLGQLPVFTRLRGNGKGMKGVPPEVAVLLVPEVLLPEVLVLLPEVLVLLPDVLVLLPDVLPDVLLPLKTGEPNLPRPSVEFGTLSCTLKLKSTPTDSKKESSTVMKRTSTVTCKSCNRRSCCSRSRISSWTF